jgi:plastocyanin domain-containing protein
MQLGHCASACKSLVYLHGFQHLSRMKGTMVSEFLQRLPGSNVFTPLKCHFGITKLLSLSKVSPIDFESITNPAQTNEHSADMLDK